MGENSLTRRVVVAEKSATLRYILKKQLLKSGFDIQMLDDFNSVVSLINQAPNEYGALIIGWPNYKDASAAQLLSSLKDLSFNQLPVLMLADDADKSILDWMTGRSAAAMIPWENYQEVISSLQKMMESAYLAEPVAANDVEPVIEEIPFDQDATDQVKLLFVDDSKSIRSYYQKLLMKQGYQTTVASSVEEAFELAVNGDFNLAIVDYFMPDQNGSVLCEKLRNHPNTQHMLASVITGTYLDEVIKECLQAGAIECMFKNEAEELFLARIESLSRIIRQQNSIDKERDRLAAILESVGDGVYGVDNDGHITFVNPAVLSILGYEENPEVIGELAVDTFHHVVNEDLEGDQLYRAYDTGTALRSWETVFTHQSGKAISVECTVYPLMINNCREGSVIAFRDISERKILEQKLRWQAMHDPLTELYNRRYFEDQLDRELALVKENKSTSALIYLDLDRFKYLNDTAGHEAGDQLLVEISRIIFNGLRETDLLARLGGDEFAIILHDVDSEKATTMAELFRHQLDTTNFVFNGNAYNIQASLGVSMMTAFSESAGEILADADIACHIAKRRGRNQYHLYEPASDEKAIMGSELGWSNHLKNALEFDQFELHFQPILAIDKIDFSNLPVEDCKIWNDYASRPDNELHYEALVRMRIDDNDLVWPNAFIPTAERFNIMRDVDLWVVENVFMRLRDLQQERQNIKFSINLSGHSLDNDNSLNSILELLKLYAIDPGSILFEVTETAAIASLESASQFINKIRNAGCHFSLDDFGSGFCSFSQIKRLPADFVKIDGQFVKNMARGAIDKAIVTAMNDVAHTLGRYTVAEYVESAEILRLLKVCGIDLVQGYYISPPLKNIGEGVF